jgi:hypothetical protein
VLGSEALQLQLLPHHPIPLVPSDPDAFCLNSFLPRSTVTAECVRQVPEGLSNHAQALDLLASCSNVTDPLVRPHCHMPQTGILIKWEVSERNCNSEAYC